MGKHHRRKQKKPAKGVRGNWNLDPVEKKNEKFEKFYKAQGIVPEAEWESFLEALSRELPHSFRFLGFISEAEALRNIMQERYIAPLKDLSVDGVLIQPPSVLPWYPKGLGYQMSIPRQVIRRELLLNNLHNFLVTESQLGSISRQESVSMLPPLFLDVRPHHKVLDMCAAPGSKTAQLVESILADESQPMPSGFVVANDSDNKRCYLLVHQSLKRLQNANCVVINQDARNLPTLFMTGANGEKAQLKFDRILCDVPCRVQFRILKRGFDLLAPGGRMVYSTCSLNPIEDEAVIARLLKETGDSLELVDVSEQLPELKRSPGLRTWKVMEIDGSFLSGFEEVKEKRQKHICASLFPPSSHQAEQFHLERCMRILPHYQDTGGFFIAVLEKRGEKKIDIPVEDEEEEESSSKPDPPHKKPRYSGYREDPFIFFDEKDPRWDDIQNHYDIIPTFPVGQVLSRSAESVQKRNLYLVNAGIKDLIVNNRDHVKIVNAGLRIFGRVEQKYEHCNYRLAQDGLRVMLSYLRKRTMEVTKEDMISVLTTKPSCFLAALENSVQLELEGICEGGVVFYHVLSHKQRVAICAWKGKVSVAPYINKDSKIHLLRLLGYDTSQIEEEVQSNRKKSAKAETAANTSEDASQSQDSTISHSAKNGGEAEEEEEVPGGDTTEEILSEETPP